MWIVKGTPLPDLTPYLCGKTPRRRRRPWVTPVVILVVILLAVASPWINPQVLAVLCAVLGGLLPLLVPRRLRAAEA
jgi:hypothetical protein